MGRGLLILVAGFVVFTGLVQLNIQKRQAIIPERNAEYFSESQLHNIANSLADYAVTEIQNNGTWDQGYYPNNFMGAEGSVEVFTYDDYKAGNSSIPSDHGITYWNEFTVLIVSRVQKNNYQSSTQVVMTKDSFSRYTYFTDSEPSNIYFHDGDVMGGPVHSNGTIKIAGSPTFKGNVTSPNMWEGHTSYDNDPIFEADTNFSADSIDLYQSANIEDLKNAATNGGLRFNSDIQAYFKTQVSFDDTLGLVDIAQWNGSSWDTETTYDLSNINGVISTTGKIYTKGEVKGKVTLHSEKIVKIEGDLTYHKYPLDDPSSTDLLGIVSEKDVIVDKDAHEDVGTEDINIHASIMAIDQSFYVENYSDTNEGYRGTIYLLGGLQQQVRGPVGTFNSSGPASGFDKDYSYDQRLQTIIPPVYPRVKFFTRVSWKEKPVTKINS
ncbi:MAG: DUF4900 domain-containing protein [Balneolaceae bacterium]|nr:DUF4900 domain-containing protein [Balneolaceae bacterium]